MRRPVLLEPPCPLLCRVRLLLIGARRVQDVMVVDLVDAAEIVARGKPDAISIGPHASSTMGMGLIRDAHRAGGRGGRGRRHEPPS